MVLAINYRPQVGPPPTHALPHPGLCSGAPCPLCTCPPPDPSGGQYPAWRGSPGNDSSSGRPPCLPLLARHPYLNPNSKPHHLPAVHASRS